MTFKIRILTATILVITCLLLQTADAQEPVADTPVADTPVADETRSTQTSRLILLQDSDLVGKLKLSDELRVSMESFLKRRVSDEQKQIAALRNSPKQVRDKRLADFHRKTEEVAIALLNPEQRSVLERQFVQNVGFAALGDRHIQNQLRLNDEQQQKIATLLKELDEKLAEAKGVGGEAEKLRYEVLLGNVLDAKQVQGWRVLSGAIDAEAAAADLLADADLKAEPDEAIVEIPANDEAAALAADDAGTRSGPASKLKFSFGEEDWSAVIEWFAGQADLSLKMPSAPEGTLSYSTDREYTVKEAMDFLNNELLQKDYTLIRYDDLLTVVNLADGIPPSVIETVAPEELDDRGKYEIVKCIFEFKEVDGGEFSSEIASLVNTEKGQGQITFLPSSNRMIVQETGGTLRTIRSILDIAEMQASKANGAIEVITLEHVSVEEFMIVARRVFKIDEDEFEVDEDGRRLNIVPELYGSRMFIDGSSEMVSKLKSLVKQVDIEGEAIDPGLLEESVIITYRTRLDPIVVEQILRRFFGTEEGMRLARDELTGFILVEGTPAQHAMVRKSLDAMEGEASATELIELTRYEPSDMILSLKSLMQVTEDEAGNPVGTLVLEEDPEENRIIVRGTPAEVAEVRKIAETIDPPIGSEEYERSNLRIIPFSPSGAARALETSSQIWPYLQRENNITYVVPGKGEFNPADPKELRKMLGVQDLVVPAGGGRDSDVRDRDDRNDPLKGDGDSQDEPSQPKSTLKPSDPTTSKDDVSLKNSSLSAWSQSSTRSESSRSMFVSFPAKQVATQSGGKSGEATSGSAGSRDSDKESESTESSNKNFGKQEVVNIPGSEIIVQVTRGEILLYSKDLDALDALEQLIAEQESSLPAEDPTVFLLEHRTAGDAKAMLEQILGISSGDSGGGGGGLGDMMGNMAQNMIPGGDLLGGLLGGGGGGSLGVLRTVGEVSIIADANLNALIVFAIDEDLDTIKKLLRVVDQEAPHDPTLDGKTYSIPVIYVDAEELVEIVKSQLAARIKTAESGGGGGGQQQNQQAEILKALMQGGRGGRGGGGGGGGGGVSQEAPKFSITAYKKANWILVTGPEFLYRQVFEVVQLLDTEDALERAPRMVVLPATGMNPDMLRDALKAIYGDKLTVEGDTSTASGNNGGASGGGPTAADDAGAAAMREAFIQRMRGGGGGAPQGRGGGGGPGGGRGGGGRGGR